MFEKAPAANSETQATPDQHELRVAVFDLSQKALASYSFAAPSLIADMQPLNEHGLPGVNHEARAVQVGRRNNLLGLPLVNVLGRIPDADGVSAYAVSTREPINFRDFMIKRFELDEVFEYAQETVHSEHDTAMDLTDAKLILASIAIKEVRHALPPSFSLRESQALSTK